MIRLLVVVAVALPVAITQPPAAHAGSTGVVEVWISEEPVSLNGFGIFLTPVGGGQETRLTSYSDGFERATVPAGDYYLRVETYSTEFAPYWYPDKVRECDAEPVTVPADTTTSLTIDLRRYDDPPPTPPMPTGRPPEDWLGALNWFRASSGIAPVIQDPCGVLGQDDHIAYLRNTPPDLMTGTYASPHTENPESPWYTPEGARAASRSNITYTFGRFAIESLMQAPYHARHLLDPRSTAASYAHESGSTLLDMLRARNPLIDVGPITFPGNGARLPLRSYRGGERPDPLDSCPDLSVPEYTWYSSYVSLPLIVMDLPNPIAAGMSVRLTLPTGETVTGPSDRLCVITRATDAARSLSDRELVIIYETSFETGPYSVTVSNTGSGDVSWEFEIIANWDELPAMASGVPPCPGGGCDVAGFVNPGGRWTLWGALAWPEESTSFYYGNPGDVPFMGDWDCDGVTTPGLYRRSDGYVYLRNSNTQGIADIKFFFGNPGDLPLAGDFNGDGCDTVSIYRPGESRVYVVNELGANDGGLGTAAYDFIFGNPGDSPFVGDFDGDSIDTVGLYRTSSGYVYFRDSLTTGIADFEFYYGIPGDVILAGDWDGDGDDTVAVYRPSTGFLYVSLENAPGVASYSLPVGEYTSAVSATP